MYLRLSDVSAFVVLAMIVLGGLQTTARAESFIGSTYERRTIVGFTVPESAAQAWLPAEWDVATFGAGPLAGANLLVVFIDRHLSLDAEGNQSAIPQYRALALVSPARHEGVDGIRIYVTRIYVPDASLNAYKNSVVADLSAHMTQGSESASPGVGEESWSIAYDAGSLNFTMAYEAGTPALVERTSKPYSSIEPDFYRIYKFRQLVDSVMSAPMQIDRVERISFATNIPELAAMFDGTEELVGVLRLPFYTRQTYLP